MIKCIKCGASKSESSDICPACTWPTSYRGWELTKLKVKRITFDVCCVNALEKDDELNIIEKWSKQGLVEVQKAHVFMDELRGEKRIKKGQRLHNHPNIAIFGNTTFGGLDVLGGPDMKEEIREMLFPTTKELNQRQKNDAQHLREHVETGGDLFVTFDGHFIKHGKQKSLRQFGIWVFKPKKAVAFLNRYYGWQ